MGLIQEIRLSRGPIAGFIAQGLCWGAFAAQVPVLKTAIDADDGAFGVALLLGAMVACVAMLLAPTTARLLGRYTMILPMLVMGGGIFVTGLATDLVGFVLAFMMATFGSASLDVSMNTELSRIESRERASLMNLNHAIFSLCYAAAAVATGVARESGLGPMPVFGALFVIYLSLGPSMRLNTAERGTWTPSTAPMPWALLVLAGFVILIGFMAEQAVEQWSALHLERGLGGSAAQGALGPALLGITMGLGRLFGQILTRGLDEVNVIRWAGILAAFGAALAGFAGHLWVAYLGFALFGLGVSVSAPMGFAIVGRSVDDAARSLAMSRVGLIGYSGFFLGPPLMGGVSELYGLDTSFIVIALLLAIMAGPLCQMLKRVA